MPQTIPIPMPSGGMNINMPSTFLDLGRSPYAQNTRYSQGIISPRPGLETYGDSQSTPFLGFVTYYLLNGTQKLVGVTSSNIYQYDASANEWSQLTYSGLSGGTINYPVSFAQCAHADGTLDDGWYLVISNGVDGLAVWNGSDNPSALMASNIRAQQIFYYKNCLVALGASDVGETDPSFVRWSATGTIDEWSFSTTNSGFAYLYDTPGTIQWAGQIGDSWAIYKNDAIVLMSYTGGTDLFRFDTIVGTGTNRRSGLLAPGMLAVLENEHIYIGKDNIYRWGGGTPVAVGDPIFRHLEDDLNWKNLESARCQIVQKDNLVVFYVPTGSSSFADKAYVYNYVEGWWTTDDYSGNVTATGLWSGYSGLLWSSLDTETWSYYVNEETTWSDLLPGEQQDKNIISNSSGQSYVQTDGVFIDGAGVAIEQNHQTPDIVPDGQEYQGRYIEYLAIELEAKGSSVTVSYSTDEGSTWTDIATQSLTSSWTWYKFTMSVVARKIRFRFYTDTLASRFYVRHFNLRVTPRGRI